MIKTFAENGINITEEQAEKFQTYYGLLTEWNQKINLTAITEYEEVVRKHFIDSALLLRCEKFTGRKGKRVLDVGTGAGFPGIVLSILCPEASFVLLDSLKKRVDFLNLVIEKLQLKNGQVFHGRAEDFGRQKDFRNQFDFVVSRAVAELPLLLEYCIPFVREDGYFISYKGRKYKEEMEMADNAFEKLSCHFENEEIFSLKGEQLSQGDEQDKRVLLFIQNEKDTDSKYPRRAGKPKKNPL